MKVAIVGGGPAGLSLARMLAGRRGVAVTVFEAAARPGGQSQSARLRDTIVEFGTVTTTLAHRTLRRWMRQEGIDLEPLGPQCFDRIDFDAWLDAAGGQPLGRQVLRYLFERYRLLSALRGPVKPGWAVEEAAQPIRAWLQRHDLPKLERFMLRYLTVLGQGFLDHIPTVQALRAVDFDLILTSLMQQESRPVQGWGAFWMRLSHRFEMRLESRVVGISRTATGCAVAEETGTRHEFDQVVCAIPLDAFVQMTVPTADETAVARSVAWSSYATSLVTARNWFAGHRLAAFSGGASPGAPAGALLNARIEGPDRRTGGHFYLCAQIPGGLELPDMKDALHTDIELRGGDAVKVIESRVFRHAPRYAPDAIRDGLLSWMERMQGQNRTWYTGATFAQDSVPGIVAFNRRLAAAIAPRFAPAAARDRLPSGATELIRER